MRTVWIDVDTQFDFCDPAGALFVKGADKCIPLFQKITQHAVERGEWIIGSVDTHAFDAWEFAGAVDAGPNGERPGFPPHCVKGTAGQLKVAGTLPDRTRFVPNVVVSDEQLERWLSLHSPQAIMLEKEVYSLFANPNAETLLAQIAKGAQSVTFKVYGVALDYCVKAAALGLVQYMNKTGLSGEVQLLEDATASVVEQGGQRAIEECRAVGVKFVSTSLALTG